ncbi:MAG: PQQ-like beta-propeller repeat protein [Planctomycetes bacterium]|nr:PQQ-like beta-propeller repeat protein [Planctomycetota bacterium]
MRLMFTAIVITIVMLSSCDDHGKNLDEKALHTAKHSDKPNQNDNQVMTKSNDDNKGYAGLKPPEADQYHSLDDLLVWRYEIAETSSIALPPNGNNPNPLVVGDIVIASIFSPGEIVALDRKNGRKLWSLQLPEYGGPHVSFADDVLYAKTSRTLYALKPANGAVIWDWTPYDEEGEWIYSSPTIEGDRLFIGDRNGILHCLSTKTGDLLWWKKTSEDENSQVNATAIVINDLVITATNAALAIAYKIDSGKEVWRQSLESGSIFQIQRLGENIIVQTSNSINLLSPGNGEIMHQWSWPGRQVTFTSVHPDGLLALTKKEAKRGSSSSSQGSLLLGLSEDDTRFEQNSDQFTRMLRYEPNTKLVYEPQYKGLGIINPISGRRLHFISSQLKSIVSLPHITDGIIYLLASETHFDKDDNGKRRFPRKVGVLLAMRHP